MVDLTEGKHFFMKAITTMHHHTKTTPQNTSKKGTPRKRPLSRQRNQFGNIAMRYYPGRGYKTALRLFRKEIEVTRGLLEALTNVGYKGNERILTPRQVQVIEDYLGEP